MRQIEPTNFTEEVWTYSKESDYDDNASSFW